MSGAAVGRNWSEGSPLNGDGASATPSGDRTRDVLLNSRGHIQWFVVKGPRRIQLVPADEVRWLEAAANYVRLHTGEGTHIVRATLTHLEAGLDPGRFRRIHRSAIVNLESVAELRSDGHGGFDVVLESGRTLRMTRTYRGNVVP